MTWICGYISFRPAVLSSDALSSITHPTTITHSTTIIPQEMTAAKLDRPPIGRGLAGHMKETPLWWDDAPAPDLPGQEQPQTIDVAIVGSGYTGLNAAIETARGGRSTVVFDAESAGWGCSSRNGGQISTSIKPNRELLSRRYGAARGQAILDEGTASLEWIGDFVTREKIDCDYRRSGRYHAAHTPKAYENLMRKIDPATKGNDPDAFAVPRSEQLRELGSDHYHGGVVYPHHAALHPAKYHIGLLALANEAGAQIIPHCPVLNVERDGKGFQLTTPRGKTRAGAVIVATNGYSTKLMPWLQRRLIPIGSYIIATDPLEPEVADRLFPTDRMASDTCRIIYYYRLSPDRRRVVFGGRVSATETDPNVSAPRLHRELSRRFPELQNVGISHSWLGTVAYCFDELAHCGTHDGIHYSAGYCGSGVAMASYLGMRSGKKVLGQAEGQTAFDDLPFPTRPLYNGKPWFLPAIVSWYRWLDEFETARGRRR